jgi:NAD(P)-dependent dehydrogenase (short-subunit alcohol dehydrogenase family)
MLEGKAAIVTGSANGIGLGIASALAVQGASILLNGLGDPGEIKKLQASLAAGFSVKVAYSGADMSKPDDTAKTKLLAEKPLSLEFATPDQIGDVAAFLCSDATAQIRGISLPVDGGWTAQ